MLFVGQVPFHYFSVSMVVFALTAIRQHTMKNIASILATNWIHILGFYLTTYLSLILFKVVGLEAKSDDWSELLLLSPLTILFLFFIYGSTFLIGFFVSLSILDII